MPRSLRLAALLLMLLASPAFAQEGGLLEVNEGLIIWTILIFLIVLFVLYKAAFPKILGAVEAREARIRELLEAAARDRQEAETLLAEQRRQTEEVRSRVQELLAEGRGAGERMRDDILAQARREQEDLLLRARRDIQGELDGALQKVREDAVELSIAAASKLIEKNLDADDNRRLVRDFLQRV